MKELPMTTSCSKNRSHHYMYVILYNKLNKSFIEYNKYKKYIKYKTNENI